MLRAFITGLAGTELSAAEARFLHELRPCGAILFTRNCQSHAQIRRLVSDVRAAVGSEDCLVLIDQEGGRVQRLRPPLGRALPPASIYGEDYDCDPDRAISRTRRIAGLLARDLRELGINTDCAPVLDVPMPGAHAIIGDRAFATSPAPVAALGRAFSVGLRQGGVLPVIKHIPGHGRATKDSHLDLPVVTASHAELTNTDFAPFKALADVAAAMTAHVIFADIDAALPASVSSRVHDRVIRGEIGFAGLLMSDDLTMQALTGTLGDRAAAVLRAGSDVALHCNGNLDEMQAVAAAVPALAGRSLERFVAAVEVTRGGEALADTDRAAAEADLAALLARRAENPESV